MEMCGEVGLLSRNVKVQGSNDQQWHDKLPACPQGFDTGTSSERDGFFNNLCFPLMEALKKTFTLIEIEKYSI